MMLGDFMTGVIHNIGNLESKMVSIKRCLKLLEIPHENLDQPRHEDEQWPKKGSIELKNFFLRYRDDTELVLKNCNFKIEGGQKIGVVGRTGAGKSTLCNAFTRIVEKEKGSIEFDGVDISNINLRQVRDSITIIPQEPTMYKGTIAYNLDPTGKIPKE
jgi:ABC-type multidrug transport system fused ATPase/permease subunit